MQADGVCHEHGMVQAGWEQPLRATWPAGSGRDETFRSASRKASRPHAGKNHVPLLMLIVVLAAVAAILCYRVVLDRMDSGLRQAIRNELQALLPESSVYVGRVRMTGSDELVVHDLHIADRSSFPRRPVLSVERAVLRGDLDVAHYLQQSTRLKLVELHGLKLDVWPEPHGGWSFKCLKPADKMDRGGNVPEIVIHDAIMHVHQDASGSRECLTVHSINGMLGQQTAATLVGRLSGRSSGLVKNIEVQTQYDRNQRSATVAGSIVDLDFSPKLMEQLPPELAKYLKQLSGVECRASSTFELVSGEKQPTTFSVLGNIASGRLQDPRLPYPLENLSGQFFCNNELLQLRSMQARSGSTQLRLNTDIKGFSLDSPMTIQAEAVDVELDRRLYASLPAVLQQQWDRLQLSGMVSGNIQLSFDGARWDPVCQIVCQGVNMTPWLFPYPLNNIKGEVTYQDNTISSERLVGAAGGQGMQASLRLTRDMTQWFGSFQCKSTGPVAINEQLITALTPLDRDTTGVEEFVRSLHPRGAIELVGATFERDSLSDTWHQAIDANIYGGSIHYDRFRYPIYDIRGRIFGKDNDWNIDRFEGRNDSGRILCSGTWTNVRQGQAPFRLEFHCFDVPAEEELKFALPSDAQYIWDELQPTGTVDSVMATIERPSADADVDIRVAIREDNSSNQATGRSLGLLPKSFPYRLSDVSCDITYEPGFVSIISATAVNGSSRFSLTGECRPNTDGRWQADIRWLPTTRLRVDSELLKALPKSIRESLVKLDFSGPVSVYGDNQILFANRQFPELLTTWNCQLDVEDGRLADGKNIAAMRGTVWVEGHSSGSRMYVSGNLGLDALTVRGVPVTNLRGPFALLGSELYFGSTVSDVLPRVGQPTADPLTADALSGKLKLSGQSKLDVGRFLIEAELNDAQLTTLLQDVGVDRASTEATCNATLVFSGIPWNPQTHTGRGRVQLRDARLYQLPFMMRVLNAASVNASDDSAFQTADIAFQIDGDRIPLQIACDGEVLRLRGEGWTNLRREVFLELYSYAGRRGPLTAVISPILAESRYATLMMIEVAGTLDNPIMQRRPFPQLEATLQQVFPEISERRETDRNWLRRR
jgi:hypothetical protein